MTATAPARPALQPGRLFIGGAFVDARSGEVFDTVNPATEEVLCEVQSAGAEDVGRAVESAHEAFTKGKWPRLAAADRGRALAKLADLIEEHAGALAELETLDTGKPIKDTQRIDIPIAAAAFRYFAGFADKIHGETIPARGPFLAYTTREPLGVVGAITPWNYPLLLASYKIAPALAFGNTVVLKPAEQAPLTALKLAELAQKAGIPDGAFNVVPGLGPVAGQALAAHPLLAKLAFTGSTATGRKVMEAASANLTKVQLELGGKSPNIIFADADMKSAVMGALWGIFSNKGEVCTAGSRLLVERKVKDQVTEELKKAAEKLKLGDPFAPDTRMGPQITSAQRERVLGYVAKGKGEGARLVTGGGAPPIERGYFVQPTIFDDVEPGMTIAQEEIFGPVLAVLPFDGVDDLVERANQTIYGLAAGVWTSDVKKAFAAARGIQAGTVWINTYGMYDPTVPFGGMKRSGFGRELGVAAVDEYTQRKSVWVGL